MLEEILKYLKLRKCRKFYAPAKPENDSRKLRLVKRCMGGLST